MADSRTQTKPRIRVGVIMTNLANTCEKLCDCSTTNLKTQLIVITGGPGAGKTAVLEMAKKVLCQHIAILPEAASIVYGGGFWRFKSVSARLAAQKAIYHVQLEMENLVIAEQKWFVGLCDRGSLDSLAYWPEDEATFWKMSATDIVQEYKKYVAVIHLQSPTDGLGYNQRNPLRIESAVEAGEIDQKIAIAWGGHPNYVVIKSSEQFLTKAQSALQLIVKNIPSCCRENLKLTDIEVLND